MTTSGGSTQRGFVAGRRILGAQDANRGQVARLTFALVALLTACSTTSGSLPATTTLPVSGTLAPDPASNSTLIDNQSSSATLPEQPVKLPSGPQPVGVLSLSYIPLIAQSGPQDDWPIDTVQARQRLGIDSPTSAPIDDAYSEYAYNYSQLRSRIDAMEPLVADALEAGTRYHGYENPAAVAALDYSIVGHLEFQMPIPLSTTRTYQDKPLSDYLGLLNELDVCDWVEQRGVREVWIWSYFGAGNKNVWESNLSFSGGDFSNSDRDETDLPLCAHSYTVYEYNYGRSEREAVHDHMHQFESVFPLINGGEPFTRFSALTSCGTTHLPPNADQEYQYDALSPASSDCESWSMSGPQPGVPVDARTWSRAVPDGNAELGYYVWWMQNVPGLGNEAGSQNWWVLIGDLDSAYPLRDSF